MASLKVRIPYTKEYLFKVTGQSAVVKVLEGADTIGWVSPKGCSVKITETVARVARKFLYEVRPELRPLGKRSTEEASTSKFGDCCEAMKLALERASLVQGGFGLGVTELVHTKTGRVKNYIVQRFPKNPDKRALHAEATVININFCPFCGALHEGKEVDEGKRLARKRTNASTKGVRGKAGKAVSKTGGLSPGRGNTTRRKRSTG